jgi:hypothetical protein
MITTRIKLVMSLVAEARLSTLFINAKEAVHIRNILTKMEHLQPRTPIQMDNTTIEGLINNCVQPKNSKPKDRKAQGQFQIHLRLGKTHLAD